MQLTSNKFKHLVSISVCYHGTGTENNKGGVANNNNNCRPPSQSKCTNEVGFDEDLEFQLNRQINTELMSFYHYLTMVTIIENMHS